MKPLISFLALGVFSITLPAAAAETVAREQDIVELRLGQKILVDDGSCAAGEIKEVTGATMTASGVARTRKCVPRLGSRQR